MWQSSFIWAIFFLIIFFALKSQFESLLKCLVNLCNKTSTVEYGSFKLGINSPIPLGEQGRNDVQYVEMLKAFQSPVITTEEKVIRNQLTEANYSPKQATDILISQLAYKNILTLLQFIDKIIFDEQIKLLLYLNEQSKPCPAPDLQHFYLDWSKKEAASSKKEVDYTFEQFISFLSKNGLILQNTIGFSITIFGKDYLSFIIRTGRKLPKEDIKNQNNR